MAANQLLVKLTAEEASQRQRPQKFWYGEDVSKLTLLRGISDQVVRVGDKLRLKNHPQDSITRHGRHELENGVVLVVDTFEVIKTETTVHVLWQDGSTDELKATDLIPYLSPDEYDCWFVDFLTFLLLLIRTKAR